MKVKELIDQLNQLNPDDSVCALVYTKSEFDFDDDDELVLTDEAWNKLCDEFDQVHFREIFQSLADGALDYAEMRDELQIGSTGIIRGKQNETDI